MTPEFVLLIAGAVCVAAVPAGRYLGRHAGWPIAAALAALAAGVAVMWRGRGDAELVSQRAWMEALDANLRLRVDGLALVFSLVVLVVGALVMAYSVNYLPRGRHGIFYGLLALFAAAMLGLVMADDLMLLWVMWELTTVCSFLLIQQAGPRGRGPAARTLLQTAVGGLCLLAAVAATIVVTGTTRLSDALASPVWGERPGVTATVALLVAVAAFTKSAQFPFHGWLPDAMVASTPVSAYLHAAAMVKAGIYLLLRFSTAFHDVAAWNAALVTIGLITAVMGAVFALQRFDLKELLAYSTVSQLGFLVATIGIGTGYAMVGALIHVIAHAAFKSALFMSVGLIDHEASTRDIRILSGLRRCMPMTSLVLALSAASMAGLPPMLGFVSKEAMFAAIAGAPFATAWVVAASVAAVAAAVCTFAYSGRMLRPLFGPAMEERPHEAPAAMVAPVALGAAAGVVLGLSGPLLEPLVNLGARAISPGAAGADLALWHGLTPALGMSATVIALGAAMVAGRHAVDDVLHERRLFPVRAVEVVDGFRLMSSRVGRRVGDVARIDSPFRHLAVPLLLLIGVVATTIVDAGVPVPDPGTTRPLDWLLTALVLVGVGLTLRARSRVTLVTTVGIVGFMVALMFFNLGAPDVALTQLLVEILTVVVMVLLLIRLPHRFHHTERSRLWVARGIALGAGVAATAITMIVLSLDEPSPVGRHYLQNAKDLTGGSNVVNTILVDFRAFDTLGEMVVLGVVAVAMVVALESRGLLPRRPSTIVAPKDSPVIDPEANTIALRMTDRIVGVVLGILSVWFFLRGHYEPGGGFIAALIAGAAVCLVFLAAPSDRVGRLDVPYMRVIGTGIGIAVATGVLGLARGSFLTPIYFQVMGLKLSTGLLFDVGVYLAVLGLILGALSRLGLEGPDPTPLRRPGAVSVPKDVD